MLAAVLSVIIHVFPCYRPSEDDPSPLEALRRGVRLREVLDKAKPIMHKSIVSFSHLRQEIFSELLHAEQVAGVKVKTKFFLLQINLDYLTFYG